MNVHQLRHGADICAVPDVLSLMPMVWCKAHPNVGDSLDRSDSMQGPQEGSPNHLGCPWPCRNAASQPCPWSPSFVSTRLRPPEQDETPLSQSEAEIASRFFPN